MCDACMSWQILKGGQRSVVRKESCSFAFFLGLG